MTWLGRCSNRRSTGRLGAGGRKTSPWDEEDFFEEDFFEEDFFEEDFFEEDLFEGSREKIDFFSWAVSEVGNLGGMILNSSFLLLRFRDFQCLAVRVLKCLKRVEAPHIFQ